MLHNMKQITVRNIPAAIQTKLRSLAERSGLSLNQTVIQLLETATGGNPEARRRDLSGITGTWDDRETEAFDRATAAFESVDEEVWR
jgi:plasmid stability protein